MPLVYFQEESEKTGRSGCENPVKVSSRDCVRGGRDFLHKLVADFCEKDFFSFKVLNLVLESAEG